MVVGIMVEWWEMVENDEGNWITILDNNGGGAWDFQIHMIGWGGQLKA